MVISIDPRRVYVEDPEHCPHETVKTTKLGPNGEQYVWWQCTVKGGREGRPLGAVELARAVRTVFFARQIYVTAVNAATTVARLPLFGLSVCCWRRWRLWELVKFS